MPANNRIEFQLDFKTGDIKALSSLKKDLAEIQRMAADPDFTAGFSTKEIQNMITAARTLDSALDQAFDVNLNTVNIQKFNSILAQSGYNAQTIQSSLLTAGTTGQQAFLKLTGQLMQFNTATKQTNKFLDSIATSLFNTIKWSAMSSIVNNVAATVQKSYYYVKDLDRSLNDIRIVTNKSAEDMGVFAEKANEAAKALAVTTEDYTQGSLIYYQQGLDDATVETLTDITAKTSNVTQQSMSTVSEQLTAVQNGYQVANRAAEEGMQVYEEYVDKMAAVGASTASDLEELSTAMSKVASAASSMGVGFDDLNAQIATIVSVTRQAPESVGTALKTIYARLGDLKVDGVDEFGTKLGEVSAQLQTMGINIIDQQGNMRNMSDVIAEVAEKWDTWTSAQRQAAAVAMAGKRQYNNLIALFDNQDMYGEALETSMNATGTLEKQQEIAMDSLANKMDVLKATAEDLYDSLFNTDTISSFLDTGTGVLQFFADFSDSIGGLNTLLPMLGSIGLQVFSDQIGRGLATVVINAHNARAELDMMKSNQAALQSIFTNSTFVGLDPETNVHLKEMLGYYQEMSQYQSVMSQEQKEQYNNILKTKEAAGSLSVEVGHQKERQEQTYKSITAIKLAENEHLDSTEKIQNRIEIIKNIIKELDDNLEAGNLTAENFASIFSKKVQKDIGLSNEAVKNLVAHLKSAYNVTGDENAALQQVRNRLQEASDQLVNITAQENKIKSLDNSFKSLGSSLKNNVSTQAFISNITSAIGAFGQLAMSIQTLKNLGSIQSDENLSAGDKMLQTVMNLSFALPGLGTSIAKIGNALLSYHSLLDITTIKEEAMIATEQARIANEEVIALRESAKQARIEANIALEKAENAELELQNTIYTTNEAKLAAISNAETLKASAKTKAAMATAAETAADNAETVAENLNSAALIKNNTLQVEQILQSKGHYLAKLKEIVAVQLGTKQVEADTAAKIANLAVTLKIVAIAGAVVIGTLAAAKAFEKHREQLIEDNKAQLENIKSKQDIIKQNQDVVNSFSKLYKEYDKTSEVTDQLKSATDKLLDTYQIENGYLLQRTENYKKLNEELEKAKQGELDLAIVQAERGEKIASRNMVLEGAQGWFNSGSILGNTYTSSFSGDAGIKILQDLANKYNEKSFIDQAAGGSIDLQIDIDDIDQVYNHYNLLLEAKKKYEEEFKTSDLNSLKSYKQITQELDAMSESYQELSQQRQLLFESRFEQTFLNEFKDLDNDSSLLSIYNKIEKIRTLFKDDLSDSELINSIQKAFGESGKFSDEIINQVLTAQAFIDKHFLLLNTDIDEKSVFEAISKLNEKEVGFLASHLDSAVLSDDLEQQVNEHSEYFTQAESRQVSSGLKDFIGKYDTKKGFEEGAVSSLYSSSDLIQEKTGLSEEQFNALDIDQQLQTATKGWINFAKESNKAADNLKGDLIPQVEEAKKALDEQNDKSINTSLVIQDLIKDNTELANKQNELEEALIKLSNQGFDNLNESDQQLIKDFSELSGVSIELLDTWGENLKTTQALEAKYNDLQGQLDELISSEVNFKEVMEKVAEVTKATNAIIDSIQAVYKSLIGIVDEYNETGKQTIDNVQALMEMSDQYVAQLEFEGNTLSLNEEGFKALTLAKIDDLIATENLAYEQKVLELAQIAESNSTDAAAQKTSLFAQMLQTLGLVSRETTTDVLNLKSAMDLIGKSGSDETKAALDQATKAHENRLKALEGLRNQINSASGSGGIRDMMGASKKGSKSGGSKKDKDKDQKEQEDEFDRYQEIKKAIDAVDQALKKLDKDQENLFGYELIASLKQENELLEQQAANYNTLYEMQQQEAAELREQLGTMGLMFDASGAITNYAAATSAALQAYAAAIEQYNAGLIDETTLGVYEKSYENFKKLLQRYDTLYYKEMQDTQDKIDEIHRKELANNLKAWETEIQIHLDMEKAKRDQNEFLKDITKDFRKVYQDLTIDVNYDEDNFKSIVNDVNTTIRAIHDVQSEIDKMMSGGTSDMFESVSQAQEKLKKLQEELLSQGKDLYALYKVVWEAYLEGMDQVKDQFDELMNKYKHFDNELKFQKELIELLYGDKAYELMDKYYKVQEQNVLAQIESLRKQTAMQESEFQKSYQNAIKNGSKVDIDDFTTWTEDMKKAYENMIESQEDLNDLILEAVKILQDQYLNSINKIMDAMDKEIWGKDGFEGMKKNQEFMQKMADEYLDAVEGSAKIQLFANRIDMDKANTSNLKAQQKLQAFRDKEIKDLREKENLTQADIDLAEARYQIMLKEIALEDAQNNKTSMKLTRNEQGNQSYQYVADEDEVGQKQQDLLQSYSDLYKLADDSFAHSMELAFDLYEEVRDRIREIAEDTTLTEEEKNQKIAEIQKQYSDQINIALGNAELYRQEAMQATAGVFQTICEQDASAYESLTEEQKRMVDELKDLHFEDYNEMRDHLKEDFLPSVKEVFEEMNINSQTTAAQFLKDQVKDPNSVKNSMIKATSEIQKAIQEYEKELDKLQQIADMDFSKIGESIDKVSKKIEDMGGTTDRMVDNSSKYLDELRRTLEAVASTWDSVIEKILESQRAMQEYINLAAQARVASAAAQSPGGPGNGNIGGATGPGNGRNGSGNNPTNPPSNNKGNENRNYYVKIPQYDNRGFRLNTDKTINDLTLEEAQALAKQYGGTVCHYDTGGYTGVQNNGDSDGRLAMLHQKELVLNADDTENFLSGISMIRDMTSMNGSISKAIANAVGNMVYALNNTSIGVKTNPAAQEAAAYNTYNITAEFPNVNDVNEIREAILSLPNLASQYIGRNIK